MPCFKGLAVSIHTPDGPIAEYSIQKQSRLGRITTYIPVPKPKISAEGNAEQSTFAISITLLTPGLSVPYSTPKPTTENPYPRPQTVGALPRSGERGQYAASITPYQSLTPHENETIAAYIYFDGRTKEEVATLLRKGEETWVNSRCGGVPESEGGGLAEREFLFKEVGFERWLNGLDLAGSKDAAEKVQRRKERLEKKRRKREKSRKEEEEKEDEDDFDPANPGKWRKTKKSENVLRYGEDGNAPLQGLSDHEDQSSSDETDTDDDDDPLPESTGQIKVALFRVLASGEIKKGEYSPQFDAHDDSENEMKEGGDGGDEDIDHATSFAKPKSLDPKTISTQTVTGIDPPDKPYAVFTFLYRGEKQLQKMGILKPKKAPVVEKNQKRKSVQESVKSLGILKSGAAERFTGIRDRGAANGRRRGSDNEMSDEDEESRSDTGKGDDDQEDEADPKNLNAEDVKRQAQLSSGVQKMKLKRQHSFEPPSLTPEATLVSGEPSPTKEDSNTPPATSVPDQNATPMLLSASYTPFNDVKAATADATGLDKSMIGSPMKKARSSLSAEEDGIRKARAEALARGLGFGFNGEHSSINEKVSGLSGTSTMFGGTLPPSKPIGEPTKSSETKSEGMEDEL